MRAPLPVIAAAAIAAVIALYDVADTIQAVLDGTAGAVFGTLLRDALLVVGGAFLLRRAAWSRWLLVALFALTLLRVLAAYEVLDLVVNAPAVPGLVLLFLPATSEWCAQPAKPLLQASS